VANSEFMFNDVQNEALAEQLREKKRFYGEQVGAALRVAALPRLAVRDVHPGAAFEAAAKSAYGSWVGRGADCRLPASFKLCRLIAMRAGLGGRADVLRSLLNPKP